MLHLAFCRLCSRAHYLLQASLSSASINVESTIVARRSSGSRGAGGKLSQKLLFFTSLVNLLSNHVCMMLT